MDEIIVKINKPFKASDGSLVSSLTVRSIKVKDMRAIGVSPGQTGVDGTMKIIAHMNDMPASDLDDMDWRDAVRVVEAASPFLGIGPGEKPSL